MIVLALQSFDHGQKAVRRGSTINVSSATANALRERGLVTWGGVPAPNPPPAGGTVTLSSALPPAPVLPQTTSNASESGEVKRKRGRPRKIRPNSEEPSLSPTQPFEPYPGPMPYLD